METTSNSFNPPKINLKGAAMDKCSLIPTYND